jgi:hypothetical protein
MAEAEHLFRICRACHASDLDQPRNHKGKRCDQQSLKYDYYPLL